MSTTKELRDRAKTLGIAQYWLKNKATLAAEIAAATKPAEAAPEPVKLTAAGRALMAAIGRRHFSFFDEGIVEGGGIWHENLTAEYAGTAGAPATTRGVADVIRGLVKAGMLRVEDAEEPWVVLTAAGAEAANALADEPVPAAKPATKKAAADAPAKQRATFDAAGLETFTCAGECGETLPVSRFVTKNGTTLRYRECRACATERRAAAK